MPLDRKEQLMTVDQVSELLGLSKSTVYQYAGKGLLPVTHWGRALRFRRESLEKLIDQKEKYVLAKAS